MQKYNKTRLLACDFFQKSIRSSRHSNNVQALFRDVLSVFFSRKKFFPRRHLIYFMTRGGKEPRGVNFNTIFMAGQHVFYSPKGWENSLLWLDVSKHGVRLCPSSRFFCCLSNGDPEKKGKIIKRTFPLFGLVFFSDRRGEDKKFSKGFSF